MRSPWTVSRPTLVALALVLAYGICFASATKKRSTKSGDASSPADGKDYRLLSDGNRDDDSRVDVDSNDRGDNEDGVGGLASNEENVYFGDKSSIIVKPVLLDSSNFGQRQKRATTTDNKGGDNNETTVINNMEEYYLYRISAFGRNIVLNLSRLHSDDTILTPNFVVQHFDDNNSTYLKNNVINVGRCLYTGRIVEASNSHKTSSGSPRTGGGSILLNLCRGMYGIVELPQGTYFLEPLLNGTDPRPSFDNQPNHILYKHQSHTFHDDYQSSPRRSKSRNSSYQRKSYKKTLHNSSRADHLPFAHAVRERHRRSYSWNYYVEVLVVADARLRRYHQSNLENYIVTLLSIVASIYRHPSIEASLNIVIVRLIVLDHENAGPKITDSAQETLKQFCRWQHSLNDADDDSINHHDVAILLTRHDICRSPGKCDTLGLAELGTMCDAFRSCAIIEDNGLSAAFTIAHELGHIFNIPHDDEKKCAQYMSLDKMNYHVMAPTLEYNTHPWSWSPCSSNILRQFLSKQTSHCLLDKPVQQKYTDAMPINPNPGKDYDVETQCQFVFGPLATKCPYMPVCKRLWCATAHGFQVGCRTQHMPWADGTLCSYNKWCYRGECVSVTPEQLRPMDGTWGNWKDWGECSRSCGGGVKRAMRDCDNPRPSDGGKYCIGERVRFRSCNTKECPNDTPDFREVQCTEFNNDRRGIHGVPANVRWVPHYNRGNANDQCKLYCAVEGRADFYLMKHKVIDGTPCEREKDDICVDGQCKKAGCDGELGSSLKRDECGICGGDGTKCRKIHGLYNEPTTYGYNSVLKIQSGVNNIDIRQRAWNSRKDDDNYLALSNSQGEFVLNGQFQVSVFRREIRVRGTVLEYSGSDSVVERINSSKPLMEDLYLHVLAVGQLKPADINWEYLVLDDPQAAVHRSEYHWRLQDQWTECNKPCHGSQTKRAVCMSVSNNNEQLDERFCEGYRKPVMEQRVCNMHCQLNWLTEATSECSVRCGAGEMSQRSFCVQVLTNGHQQRVDDAYCRDMDRPPDRTACFIDCAGRRWTYTEWDQCSKSCNGGVQRRAIKCVDQNGNPLAKHYCENLISELLEQTCNAIACPVWQYGDWSQCSVSCGGGVQVRHASCVDTAHREIGADFCNVHDKHDRRKCNENVCAKWKFSGWSECSKTCGNGTASRDARCVDSYNNVLDEILCPDNQKIVSKPCHMAPCPNWSIGEWSACSKTCLDGWSTRRVTCVDSRNEEIDNKYCRSLSDVPPSHRQCNHGPCPFWRAQSWSSCSVSCGSGQMHRLVECVYHSEVVDSGYCRDMTELPRYQTCHLLECPDWESNQWEQCSVTCGDGYQRRTVRCVYPESRYATEPEMCNQDKKPKAIRECRKATCPATTTTATTTTTMATTSTTTRAPTTMFVMATIKRTSGTTQRHSITTFTSSSNFSVNFTLLKNTAVHVPRTAFHDDTSTHQSRYTANRQSIDSPQSVAVAAPQVSPTKWEMGAWSECSTSCGTGEKMRYVACRDVFSRILPDIYCSHDVKPHDREHCDNSLCGQWQASDWKQCPATCGEGHKQHRKVHCVLPNTDRVIDSYHCNHATRPENEQICHLLQCPNNGHSSPTEPTPSDLMQFTWRVGDWGQCSASCGYGWQQRLVVCHSHEPSSVDIRDTSLTGCNEASKPEPVQQCEVPCTQWSIGDWSECNKSCGGGYQRRMVECVQVDNGQVLPTQNCPHPPPKPSQPCNMHRCQRLIWRTGKWSACSATCGRGIRTRDVDCLDEEKGQTHDGNSSDCETATGSPKPEAFHRCRMARCPRWNRGKWSPCSVSCGEGVRRRSVFCSEGRRNHVLDHKCLSLPKPEETARCHMSNCPVYRWENTEWTKCSLDCGVGKQTRDVYCVNNYGQRAPASQCVAARRPIAFQNCTAEHCPYVWVPGSWSTCSKSCGEGEQYRSLHCQMKGQPTSNVFDALSVGVNDAEGQQRQVPAYHCSNLPKPPVMRHCSLGSCAAEVLWKTDLWAPCSVSCGWGVQERQTYCVDKNDNRIDRSFCSNETRPRRRRRCFLRNCEASDCSEVKEMFNTTHDGQYNVLVSGHVVKIYCFGMNGTLPKEFLTLTSGPSTNFAEFYGRRLLFPFTCPNNGKRNDSCPCTEESNPKPGLTRFEKVRVDLQNMKINIMDNQFAFSESGEFIPYATAGDCYSAVDCPQGRFSIDLRGTGFKVSSRTYWQEDGHRTAKHINIIDEGIAVHGSCGGYCGKCYPDKRHGLSFEIDSWQFNEVQ